MYSAVLTAFGLGSLVAAAMWPAVAAELKMAGIGLLGLAAPRPDIGGSRETVTPPEQPQ